MNSCLNEFFRKINWNQNSYSNLNLKAKQLLNFKHPELQVSIGKTIAPEFKSSYTISSNPSVGYIFTTHDRLLHGQIYRDGFLEGLICKRSGNWLVTASLESTWNDNDVKLQMLQYNSTFNNEIVLSSKNQIAGISTLGQFGDNWSFGAELYYTHKENSGGLSLGSRFETFHGGETDTATCIIINPFMGHFQESLYVKIRDGLRMATQYDFNMFSFDADLSCGMEFEKEDLTLKSRISLLHGLGVTISNRFEHVLVSIGISSGFEKNSSQLGISFEIS
jgi:distribution and morphology protein 10